MERKMETAIFNGPLVPYVRTTQRAKWVSKPYKRYQAWKSAFRLCLNTQGFPSELGAASYELEVEIYANKKVRYDLDNALKAVMDAAWSQDRQIKVVKASLKEDQGIDFDKVTLCRAL